MSRDNDSKKALQNISTGTAQEKEADTNRSSQALLKLSTQDTSATKG
jgi:hypothetical protein